MMHTHAVFSDGREVRRSPVPLIFIPAVARLLSGELLHEGVAGHFGNHARGRYRRAQLVRLDLRYDRSNCSMRVDVKERGRGRMQPVALAIENDKVGSAVQRVEGSVASSPQRRSQTQLIDLLGAGGTNRGFDRPRTHRRRQLLPLGGSKEF